MRRATRLARPMDDRQPDVWSRVSSGANRLGAQATKSMSADSSPLASVTITHPVGWSRLQSLRRAEFLAVSRA